MLKFEQEIVSRTMLVTKYREYSMWGLTTICISSLQLLQNLLVQDYLKYTGIFYIFSKRKFTSDQLLILQSENACFLVAFTEKFTLFSKILLKRKNKQQILENRQACGKLRTSHCINESQYKSIFRFIISKTRVRRIEKEEYIRYIYSE